MTLTAVKLFAAGSLIAVAPAFVVQGLLAYIVQFGVWLLYRQCAHIFGDTFLSYVSTKWLSHSIFSAIFYSYVVVALIEELCKYYTFNLVEDTVSEDDTSLTPTCRHRGTSCSKDKKQRMQQKARNITAGMISVAAGFAFAENFLFAMILAETLASESKPYNRADFIPAWINLFIRLVTPMHVLAAAMQSIRLIRKCAEKPAATTSGENKLRVTTIILPAVLLHGSVVTILEAIYIFVESAWDHYLREVTGEDSDDALPYYAILLSVIAWMGVTAVMFVGVLWYHREMKLHQFWLEQEVS
jgi:PrsW family intramembrane metalloprotease